MNEGIKLDQGKLPIHLIPVYPLQQIADVLRFGANKYEERNWEKGIAYSRLYSAAMRHMLAWWSGEDHDAESGISHLAHAACCIMMLQELSLRKPSLDDRPNWDEDV